MPEALTIRALTGGYGPHPVLHGLVLGLDEGSLMAVVGPNGHGKSTLLRAISGILPKAAGQIRLHDMRIDDLCADQRARAGLVHIPQGDLLFKDLSVCENLSAGGFFRRGADLQQGFDEVYALFPALAERRHQRAASLSGGSDAWSGSGAGSCKRGAS